MLVTGMEITIITYYYLGYDIKGNYLTGSTASIQWQHYTCSICVPFKGTTSAQSGREDKM